MTRGDVVSANNATSGSGTFTIQPGVGIEWVIHNLACSGACNIILYDGSTSVTIDQPTGAKWISGLVIHLNHTTYLQMTDTSASTNDMHYDGIVTST